MWIKTVNKYVIDEKDGALKQTAVQFVYLGCDATAGE